MAKIGAKNKFDFDEHRLRMGEIDADGNLIQQPSPQDNLGRDRGCPTIPMTHPTRGMVQINAHEADSIATWRKLGYKTAEDLAGPVQDAAAINERAKLKAELMAEIRGELAETKKAK